MIKKGNQYSNPKSAPEIFSELVVYDFFYICVTLAALFSRRDTVVAHWRVYTGCSRELRHMGDGRAQAARGIWRVAPRRTVVRRHAQACTHSWPARIVVPSSRGPRDLSSVRVSPPPVGARSHPTLSKKCVLATFHLIISLGIINGDQCSEYLNGVL